MAWIAATSTLGCHRLLLLILALAVLLPQPVTSKKQKPKKPPKAKKSADAEEESMPQMPEMPKRPLSVWEAVNDTSTLKRFLKQAPKLALTEPLESGLRLTHWAAVGGKKDVLKLLVKKGADPWNYTHTPEKQACLHMACQAGFVDVVEYLLSSKGRASRSKGALTLKEAVDLEDAKGNTGLHLAAVSGHAEVIRLLGRQGANVMATKAFASQKPMDSAETVRAGTPLHSAAAVNNADAVRALLELGADACALNPKDQTPGYVAREEDSWTAAKILAPKEKEGGCARKKDRKAKSPTEL
eukprot:gnl/TRDRNA2_/TRDRNA2_45073_c0_seq1.p1 gnl/TRDRNA2_/TRDRNA2_45073_c0~~gnl/TRDRNA2_/TRDRNA2_45073_c0_seq1.p1  ORF type:complete len:299 (+),score=70.16 gnl/TRDRNA2_/TRDRNA2_45073_c0_seq1:47-943(+)